MKDKVTVVTVSYNADKVIEPTIKSVVNQTYRILNMLSLTVVVQTIH